MPDLTISGTVTDNGQTITRILLLNVLVTLWREDEPVSHVYEADLSTGAAGAFSWTIDVKPAVEDDFTISGSATSGAGQASGKIAVEVSGYVPGAGTLHYESPVVAIFSRGQTFVGMANTLVDDLRYDLDLDGLNTITVNAILDPGQTTTDAFADVGGLILELMHIPPPTEVKILGITTTITYAPTLAGSVPTVRNGNTYTARLFYDPDPLLGGEQYFRFRSDGPDFANQIVSRTPLLPASWLPGLQTVPFAPSNPYEAVLIARIDQAIGVGSISAEFPDRTFQFPFILKDPDLDFSGGKIRVRGAIGIGTGRNMILLTIGHFEALFSLTPVNYEGQPFKLSELKSFFKVTIADSSIDLLPGTDLDDLPLWVYIAIGAMRVALGLGPSLAGAALVIAAIEAIFRPVVADLVEAKALASINGQIENQVGDEIDDQIEAAGELAAAAGLPLSDETKAEMKANVWVEAEKVTITADELRLTGWAGVLHDLVNGLQDSLQSASCPFTAAAGQGTTPPATTPPAPSSPSTLPVFRDFKDLLDVDDLRPWMQRYDAHRAELLKIVRTRPEVVERLVKVSRQSHDATRKPGWKMPAATVRGFAELSRELRATASPELARLMVDLEGIIGQGRGKTVAELKSTAATRLPPEPSARLVPAHRMGRGAGVGARRRRGG